MKSSNSSNCDHGLNTASQFKHTLACVPTMRLTFLFSLVGCTLLFAGCAAYQFGSGTLYNPNVRTIHVPIVRNDTFRHNVGVQLTEAVIRSIEQRTPYKVVADPNADSTLTCRISNEAKRVVAETVNDDPRVLNATVSIELTWTDRRGNLLLNNRFVPPGELSFYFIQGSDFIPEGGQSMATAQHEVVEQLADQIVNQMESRW